ncbi:uncharacterized protein LOC107991967 [Cucumis melo]|uniref:Uncharacterized protein LOC107991967 n=1 Tax=Cucumis melo TaxID=3656 RepID=A0A1S4E418_CUCME|nr:uncharacterized protein LOC107991967 [Cucumis melo]
MTDDKPVVEQIHEYENLVANVLSEGMKMCEILQANVLLEKFPSSWNDYRNHLKHKKRDLKLQELISHMRTEEANRLKDKLASQNLNSVNANLVKSSFVNRDRTKQEKGHKGKNSEKRQFKTTGGQIKKKRNLVSGSLLNRVGLKIVLEGDKVILTKNGDFVGKGYLSNGLFVLNTISMNANASSSAYLIESANLWHGRLEHVNFASIRKLRLETH